MGDDRSSRVVGSRERCTNARPFSPCLIQARRYGEGRSQLNGPCTMARCLGCVQGQTGFPSSPDGPSYRCLFQACTLASLECVAGQGPGSVNGPTWTKLLVLSGAFLVQECCRSTPLFSLPHKVAPTNPRGNGGGSCTPLSPLGERLRVLAVTSSPVTKWPQIAFAVLECL